MDFEQPVAGLGLAGALISAIAAGIALYLRARSRERLAALQGASSSDRVRLIADAVAMFDIPVEGLTKEQRYDLVVKQLEDRNRQRQRVFVLAIALMIVLAGVAIAFAMIAPSQTSESSYTNEDPDVVQQTGDRGVNIYGSGNVVTTM